jgi:DNA-binding NtrC family response regulator
MSQPYLLIVHPDKPSRLLLRGMLEGLNYRISEAAGYRTGIGMLERDPEALVLAGADAGDPEASEFLGVVQRRQPHVPLILLLSGEAPDLANQALRHGAASVMKFPSATTRVRAAVVHALSLSAVATPPTAGEVRSAAPAACSSRSVEAALVGEDASLRQALDLARTAAPLLSPILIVGEAGCGKSLLARVIHEMSPRRNGPFVEVLCRGGKASAVEETLFGDINGRAEPDRAGKVAQAQGGTLVLDEVNELVPVVQLKLYQRLQDGLSAVPRPGRTSPLDVRLILTGRTDSLAETGPGRFWSHIYAQNSCTTLRLPALRERSDDVIRLATHFLARSSREHNRAELGFTPEALDVLRGYGWPGNIAELKTVVARAVVRCPGVRIGPGCLGLTAGEGSLAAKAGGESGGVRIRPLREALAEPEKWLILRALQAREWNRQDTADALLINRATLEKKMKKYGLFTCEILTTVAELPS